jgi:TusA-related sulfurtransferase
MAEAPTAEPIPIVDGTSKQCTGIIAGLETVLRRLPDGATVVALVADVPSRIEVHAWAERKGHSITAERKEAGRFHITLVKAGHGLRPEAAGRARPAL